MASVESSKTTDEGIASRVRGVASSLSRQWPLTQLRSVLAAKQGHVGVALMLFVLLRSAVSWGISLWLASELGSQAFGVYSYGILLAGICTVLAGCASDRTLIRDLVHADDPHAMFTASLVQRTVAAAFVGVAAFAWLWFRADQSELIIPAIICLVVGPLTALSPKAWCDIQYQMDVHEAILFGERLAFGAAVAFLFLATDAGVSAAIPALCLVATQLCSFVVQWHLALRTFRPTISSLSTKLRFLTVQNSWVLGAAIANLLLTHANQLVLESTHGVRHLAYYVVAYQMIRIVQIVQTQFARLLAPKIAKVVKPGSVTGDVRQHLWRFSAYALGVGLSLSVVLYLAVPHVLARLFPPDFLSAVSPFRILCVWCVVFGLALVVNQFVIGLRLNRSFFLVTVIAGVLAIAFGYTLVPRYGANGVAVATFSSHSLSVVVQYVLVWTATRNPVKVIQPL